MEKAKKLWPIFLLIVVILVGVGIYVFMHRGEESTDDAAIDGRVVTISAKVSGYVKTLNINDNQVVKAGDILLEIDPTDYQNKRDHARAALDAATAAASASQNNMETTDISAPSNLESAKAQVDSAQANWEKADADLKRMQRLTNEARSQEQLDQAMASERAAKSTLEDSKARLRSAETAPKAIAAARANADELTAQQKQAEADFAQAEKDLNDTKVIAPMDGRITKRGVERGDYVQPGQALTSLVGTDLWVTANFKETQLEHMVQGQKVDIRVDAFPNLKLEGKVDSLQSGTGSRFTAFPPENATGNFVKIVQRVPVKIIFTSLPDDVVLGPGMSVEPTVYTHGDGHSKTADNENAKDQ
jgi:membrane fusion protein, multidrug efflux system